MSTSANALNSVRQLERQNQSLRTSATMFCIAFFSVVIISCAPARVQAQSASSGTVPFVLDGNRVYAEVEFITPVGKPRKALVFVDLGSGSMILSKDLYAELGAGSNKTFGLRMGEMRIAIESADVATDAWLPFSIGEDRKVESAITRRRIAEVSGEIRLFCYDADLGAARDDAATRNRGSVSAKP